MRTKQNPRYSTPATPVDGERVLIRIRYRSRSYPVKQEWATTVIPATYWNEPFGSESGHFHGHFGVDDSECTWHEVEVLEWCGFSGGAVVGKEDAT